MEKLIVSIEQDDCTGCSRCPDFSKHFFMGDSGFAYVTPEGVEGDPANPDLKGSEKTVDVTESDYEEVIEAAEICPGECIMVSLVEVVEIPT